MTIYAGCEVYGPYYAPFRNTALIKVEETWMILLLLLAGSDNNVRTGLLQMQNLADVEFMSDPNGCIFDPQD